MQQIIKYFNICLYFGCSNIIKELKYSSEEEILHLDSSFMLPQYFKFKSKYSDVDNKAYTKLINQNSKKFQVLTILLELGV